MIESDDTAEDFDGRVAIIGMSGRFPGARDLATFWANLRNGVESVEFYSEEELLAAGESIDNVRDPSYVPASARLDGIDQFDAGFFGMSPRDAAVFDPQHRLFLECAWETLEHAGYVGDRIAGAVGVFASCGLSEYMFKNVMANEQVARSVGEWLVRHTGNDTNFLATRVSYEFDLHGPSMNVQTACSSTLVALHLACQSLLSGECDVALAGGSVVSPVQNRGYFYKEGEILSPDGHCRAFDASSAGTIISSACGCVLLKPLSRALEDGDNVLAVIRGSAVNNDGRAKVGYLAPSVDGQSQVIVEALAIAGVEARDVSYIETHGTGTLIGDPIEIAGLTHAYRESTDDTQFCAIGSLKSNIGHTGEAAGVAAVIKTVLALQNREIPPSLHFQSPNPQADLPNSPFFVNAQLRPWTVADGATRIAGITGLGAGGTNAHIIVEEAPRRQPSGPARDAQLITLSARSAEGVGRAAAELAAHLRAHPDTNLADVAYTRLVGRKQFRVRRFVVASVAATAAAALEVGDPKNLHTHHHKGDPPSVVFMLPGGGAQYAGMGRELYDSEPVYRSVIDDCAAAVRPTLGVDLRSVLYPDGDLELGNKNLERPSIALPALFATECAMAKLLESWGIAPTAMIGHSAGEYAAACLAGVISMRDGLSLVALRGRLFETLPAGAMSSVPLSADVMRGRLPDGLSIAAANAPDLCVISGPIERIIAAEESLAADDIETMRIHIEVAAHSSMLEPILEEFGAFCRTIRFSPPSIPYVSNLTGTWITESDVTNPDYWVRHLRETVRFGDGMNTILEDPDRMLLEIGPGRTLISLARQSRPAVMTASTMRHPSENTSDLTHLLGALGAVWAAGIDLDGERLHAGERRRRVPLPTYPFERQRYWVEPDVGQARTVSTGSMRKRPDIADWFYTSSWKRSLTRPVPTSAVSTSTSMVITAGHRLADRLRGRLARHGDRVITVRFGDGFQALADGTYVVNPASANDWTDLVDAVKAAGGLPDRIVHMTAVGDPGPKRFGIKPRPLAAFDAVVQRDQASMLFLARALSAESHPMQLYVVTSGVHALGTEPTHPARALVHGACRVIPRELGHVGAVAIDVDVPGPRSNDEQVLVDRLLNEVVSDPADGLVVYRRGERWIRSWDPIRLPSAPISPWKAGGVYLITGGLGGIGLAVATQIAQRAPRSTVVLVGRTELADEAAWPSLLQSPATDPRERHRIEAITGMRALDVDVIVCSADVTDETAMARVVDDVRQRKGHITGVIHSAGIMRDALIALRTPHVGSPVVDVKARGVMVLDELLAKDPPEVMVLCSSVSSIIGLPGQVDYTAANAFLDAYAIEKSRSGRTRVITVNWNAWREVGMAVDAARAAVEKDRGLVRETTATAAVDLAAHGSDDSDELMLSARLSRERNWLLAEHVVRGGDALIPGTGYLEIMRTAAMSDWSSPHGIELRDVFFLSPFAVADGESRTLNVKVDRSTSSVLVFSDVETAPHATATVAAAEHEVVARHDLVAARRRCNVRTESFDGYSQQRFMQFGPRWGSLRRIEYGDGEALVTTEVPAAFAAELQSMWLHPALLDVATGSAQALLPSFVANETFYVPFSYGRVLSRGPIPARAVSHVRLRESSAADLAVFDIAICDEEGNEVVSIAGFTMRRVADAAQIASRRAQLDAAPSATESPIETALREGMMPAEGVDALDRILAADIGPQVVASSVDLHQWIAKVDAEALATESDDGDLDHLQFERPEISVAFEAPRTPIERELATMWRDLLGVERVGRNDDFFELGGQSLIAVRLFTRIRKKYTIDLPLATLFEAPTIGECAAIVAAGLGINDVVGDEPAEQGTADAGTQPPAAAPPRLDNLPFRSLVTIQKGANRTPYFCVHGAGGNVLNFRDMSLAMGRNQPFYGLQARGVDGVLAPHESIEEMAAAYLAEVFTVQPTGPYMFGGYSGGGLVAYEMAQQVVAGGGSVALVLLLDTVPVTTAHIPITMARRLRRLATERTDYLRKMVTRRQEARRYGRKVDQIEQLLERGQVIPSDLREIRMEQSFGRAADRYVPRPYNGRVMLIRAADPHFVFDALGESYGWDQVASGIEVVRVPGNHDTLVLEPNASTLVRVLRQTLDSTLEPIEQVN